MEFLEEFENLIVLRTVLDSKKRDVVNGDKDYISTGDLEEIVLLADELGIDLSHTDFYNSELDAISIFEEWSEDINELKEKLLKKLNGDYMAFDVNDARKLANENGFQKKVDEQIDYVERQIKKACEYGRTSTCVFAHYRDSDKSDVDRAVKEHFLNRGFKFKQTGVNGGVVQTTEDICW